MKYIYTRDEVIEILSGILASDRRNDDASTCVHKLMLKLMKERDEERADDIDKLKRLVSVQIPAGEDLELGDVVYMNDEGKLVKTK